jgi:hypothetical protein
MGLFWLSLAFAIAVPESTITKKLLGAAVFGTVMGFGQVWAVRRRSRKRLGAEAARSAETVHWTSRSTLRR